MATSTVLKTVPQQAVVRVLGPGSVTINLADLKTAQQTFDSPNAKVNLNSIAFSVSGTVVIQRNGANVFKLTDGQETFQFAQMGGYVIDDNSNANVVVNFLGTADGTVVMGLSKLDGFIDPDQQRFVSGN
jgi:hypothetical protein